MAKVLLVFTLLLVVKVYTLGGASSDNLGRLEISPLHNKCEDRQCSWNCCLMDFPGGICFKDWCKCNLIPSDDGFNCFKDIILDALPSVESCNLQQCIRMCHIIGVAGACVSNQCKCDINI